MKSLILSAIFLCTIIGSFAQQKSLPAIRPLTVGDIVPDIEFINLINYHSKTARLSDFKGKLVILDFWATWCGACIKQFPKIDSLQKIFKDKVQFILVNSKNTGNTKESILAFLKKRKIKEGTALNIPLLAEDTVLDKLFPHLLIPHYVWIDNNGRFIATTDPDAVKEETIEKIVNGATVDIPQKKDINIHQPVFIEDVFDKNGFLHYSFFMKGKDKRMPGGKAIRKSGNVIRGLAFTNKTVLDIYQGIISGIDQALGYDKKRIILEIKDSAKVMPLDGKINDSDLYTIDFIEPLNKAERLYNDMLDEVNRWWNYTGQIEKREVTCYALIRINREDKIHTKGDLFENKLSDPLHPYIKNAPIGHLVSKLNRLSCFNDFPVIDETNYTDSIDITFHSGLNDINGIIRDLKENGLDLIMVQREMEMFVLYEKR